MEESVEKNFSVYNLAGGLLSIYTGIDLYSSGWSSKYQQPISKSGCIALIVFGVVLIINEIVRCIRSKKKKIGSK